VAERLKALSFYDSKCRVCATEDEAKNLAAVKSRTEERTAGATEQIDATVKGKIIEYTWWMKKQGYATPTIRIRAKMLQLLARAGADLLDPESVKEAIARETGWSEGTKVIVVVAYNTFLRMLGRTWEQPRYKAPQGFPFIPLESEIDALINSSGRKMACFLQGLKDTGADPGELAQLEWTDINVEAKSVTIRHPVKGHNPRVIPVSDVFLGRLGGIPRSGNRIFCTLRGLQSRFNTQRRRIVQTLGNPRISKISFRTFRHWKGTMEYHKTKDILHVKGVLGHKTIQSTMVYINLEAAIFQTACDEFTVRVARSLDEACRLIESGFDYVTDMEGATIFRRRR
jgi:integrase